MFKITKIYIDGFRNISDTTLRLKAPVTLLLAPNNFGKSNVLAAIEFAAGIMSVGLEIQSHTIGGNGYTTYNLPDKTVDINIPKCFTFEIEFKVNSLVVDYLFKVSPKKGVLLEKLKVGNAVLFERTEIKHVQVGSARYSPRSHNLLLPYIDRPDEEVAKYAHYVRRLFYEMEDDLFCGHGNSYDGFSYNSISLQNKQIEDLTTLIRRSKEEYNSFRQTFLGLFKSVGIVNFALYDVGGKGKRKIEGFQDKATPFGGEDYRLEFTTKGKDRPETIRNLSTGTQRVFFMLLEIYLKKTSPLLAIEEIENGIHPSLHRNILSKIDELCRDSRILVTTHSPSVVRHFDDGHSFDSFYVGVPCASGQAKFSALNGEKEEVIEEKAIEYKKSFGELIVDMLSGTEDDKEELKGWLRG